MRGGRKKEPENTVMANMSEQMSLNTLQFVIYFTLPSKLEKNITIVDFCVRKINLKLIHLKTDSFVCVSTRSTKGMNGADDANGLLYIQYHQKSEKVGRKKNRVVVSIRKFLGAALEMTAGTTNSVSTEHGDITAAAAAVLASVSANSWPICKYHAYGMGSIHRWRKEDKGGIFLRKFQERRQNRPWG